MSPRNAVPRALSALGFAALIGAGSAGAATPPNTTTTETPRVSAAATRVNTALPLPSVTSSAPGAPSTNAAAFHRDLKRLEYDLLHAGARSKRVDRAKLRASWEAHTRGAPGIPWRLPGARLRRARDLEEAIGAQGLERRAPRRRATRLEAPANHRVNNRATDPLAGSTQSEASIAAHGARVIAAWNDAANSSTGSLGYGWSDDGGETWTDAGGLPGGPGLGRWVSDPVVTVNERTGVFYLAGMAITTNAENAIGVVRGRFEDGELEWDPMRFARIVRDTLPDKPWIAADSTSGNLYLTYTAFYSAGTVQLDQIEFQRCRDDNQTWERPVVLSSSHDLGLVQGSRPAVGPDGEVNVVWGAVDTTLASAGLDWLRFRASGDRGASFGAEETVAGIYSNFGSGAPGFNRGYGFVFPGLAVDRSRGPYRGRVYAIWNEGVNYFDDAPGDSNPRFEREPNTSHAQATPFNIGETVRGAIGNGNDVDLYRFHGLRDTTIVIYLDSLATTLDVAVRLTCGDDDIRLAYSAPVWPGRTRAIVFTLPRSDQYFLQLVPIGSRTGGYRFRTGFIEPGPERARDHRDVFVAARDPLGAWRAPVRVNQSDPWFDDWMPEVAVAGNGRAYVAWYDWRDATDVTCGGSSNVFLARSDDGGSTWDEVGAMSDGQTDWTSVASLIAPNQGDYLGLYANDGAVSVVWADGREGDPDVYSARHELSRDPPVVPYAPASRIERVSPNPARGRGVALDVELALTGATPATLELIDLSGRRVQVQPLGSPGAGRHAARFAIPSGMAPGVYWLRLLEGGRGTSRKVALLP